MGCEYIKQIDFNGNVYQSEQDLSESGFNYEKEQLYFEFEIDKKKVVLGMKDLLICLRFAEKQGEIPNLDIAFWQQVDSLYGCDIISTI